LLHHSSSNRRRRIKRDFLLSNFIDSSSDVFIDSFTDEREPRKVSKGKREREREYGRVVLIGLNGAQTTEEKRRNTVRK